MNAASAVTYGAILAAFSDTGLAVRGGFLLEPDEVEAFGPIEPAEALPRSLVLLGNVGPGMWPAFETGRRQEANPLDAWTKRVVDPIARSLGARAVYPSDRPFQPFQRWAQRAEAVHPSPIGILIHPEHGLWHAYRAALLLPERLDDLPARIARPSPCESCVGRPCLAACPVGAFGAAGYDVPACATHLRSGAEPRCMKIGCRARAACPVGCEKMYSEAQLRFHMNAFLGAR